MANKKISQLNSVDPSVGIGPESVFPMVSGTSSSNYQTSKVTSVDIAKFVLNPIPVGQPGMESIGFTGNSNIYFKKTNWDNASTNVAVNPYLQVNLSDGRLITGSGVAVPAALGDQMGNCTATEDLKMQGYDIIRANEIYFGGTSADDYAVIDYSYYAGSPQLTVLKIRSDDLTLSGTRHVSISGQALDLASTPISGNVTFTGGNVTVDPSKVLFVNEINSYIGASAGDKAVLSISGAARFFTNEAAAASFEEIDIDWKDSNIQYDTVDPDNLDYVFSNVRDGQTVTMYIENTHATETYTPAFTSGTPNTVLWGGTGGPPHVAPHRTNVYTFAAIHTGIFAAAITGYEY
jgi:hypothetical protein|tara:strand:- start:1229 stop:2275 length:1047 start_codon:yes stop_codon:yes gene_type:complete